MDNGHQLVRDVIKNSYRIPKYQRGYRWSEENVTKLLEDIYEDRLYLHDRDEKLNVDNALNIFRGITFEYDETLCTFAIPKNPYCIQPLVVVPICHNDEFKYYDVIDGQQRLTTIAIIRAALKKVGEIEGIEALNLLYQSREKSSIYIHFLYNKEEEEPKENNIDFDYMKQAYEVAEKYYKLVLDDFDDVEIKKLYARYLDAVLCENTQFIWYSIECGNEEPQKVFANFNTGKIELTNSELIKALFMNPSNYKSVNIKDKQIVISEKWDEMENKLHEPEFWAFVPHPFQYQDNKEYSTRIDILFDYLVIDNWFEKNPGKKAKDYIEYRNSKLSDKYIFNEIEGWIKKSLSEGLENTNEIIEECWRKVGKIYSGLVELYSGSSVIYNMVGLYINLMNRNANTVDDYVSSSSKYIEVYFGLKEILSLKRSERVNSLKKKIKDVAYPSESKRVEQVIKEIKYKEGQSVDIVKTLIIYNVAVLCSSKGTGERYNFLENARNQWEREHIFATNVKDSQGKDLQYKGALEVLAGDDYIEYVKYLYNLGDLDVKFKSENIDYILDLDREDVVQKFIDNNLAYDGNGQNEILARALRCKKMAEDLLDCYNNIDKINRIMNMDRESEKDLKKQLIHQYFLDLKVKFYFIENMDVRCVDALKENIYNRNNDDIVIEEIDFKYKFDSEKYKFDEEKEAWQYWLNRNVDGEDSKTNYDVLVDDISSSYRNKFETMIYKDDSVKDELEEDKMEQILLALKLSKKTLQRRIDDFFELDFPRLLKDNSMGNMTLLTGSKLETDSSGQNQIVSNKSYREKKDLVYSFFKQGQFVPLGTLLVFTDIYTRESNIANYWLPNSRLKYLKDMVTTITEFLGEGNKND